MLGWKISSLSPPLQRANEMASRERPDSERPQENTVPRGGRQGDPNMGKPWRRFQVLLCGRLQADERPTNGKSVTRQRLWRT